jgi:hypothetical protein
MAKEKKSIFKKWWFWLIVIIIIGAAATGGEEDVADGGTTEEVEADTDNNSDAEQNKEEPAPEEGTEEETEEVKEEPKFAGIGEPVKVGDVLFTVNGRSTASNVGGEFGSDAQGVYLILDVTVKNEGKEAITTDSSFFKLLSGDVEYDADGTAAIYANEDGNFFLQDINPGIENTGEVVFDVPEDIANSNEITVQVQTGFFGTETGEISLAQ